MHTYPSPNHASEVPLTTPSPNQAPPPKLDEPYVLSYFTLRRAAGWIGIALPVIVVALNMHCLPDSISGSYYTGARDWFVGGLCAVGIFLLCSVGYTRDTKYSVFAGLMAFLVAFDPCEIPKRCGLQTPLPYPQSPYVHGVAAVLLFLTFAFFCLVLFTRSKEHRDGFRPRVANPSRRKTQRNIVFVACGSVMLLAMASLVVDWLVGIHMPYITLVVEWVCLWAFGFAWLVKGQQLLKDLDTPD